MILPMPNPYPPVGCEWVQPRMTGPQQAWVAYRNKDGTGGEHGKTAGIVSGVYASANFAIDRAAMQLGGRAHD